MMDIAPLGFGIDTSGLVRAKNEAAGMAAAVGKSAESVTRLTAAAIAGAKADHDAAKQAAALAKAKLDVLLVTEKSTGKEILAAKALADTTAKAVIATKAHLDLAIAEKAVGDGAQRAAGQLSTSSAVMQGVAREAAAMASTMGLGSMGGRLGAAGAMGAAQGAAARLAPQLAMLGTVQGKIVTGVAGMVVGYTALSASIADNQDKWASYQQQLANSLGGQGAAASSLRDVVDLANEVGIGVDTALTSFNRFARAREDIGATNEELLLLTETVMKLGRSSGVESGAMQGAMMQLSQALASGRLNGDELRSIMENMQPLAKAIAEGLGVGIGELRRMGAEGELTGEKVFRSLLSQSGKAEAAFKTMPKTVEQAKTRMSNQFDELAAHLGKLTGASQWMQRNFEYLTKPIEWLNNAFNAVATDGMAKVETNLEKLEARVNRVKTKTAVDEEFDKTFNKDAAKQRDLEKQRTEAEDRQRKHIEKMQGLLLLMRATNARMQSSRPEIDELLGNGRRGKAFEKDALARVGDLGLTDFQAWKKQFDDIMTRVGLDKSGIAELNRQIEQLKANDPFEKMTKEVRTLETAMGLATGGMIGMRVQAEEIASTTGRSVEEVIAQLTRLKQLQTDQDISGKQRAASIQRELAEALSGGQNKITAESAAEAAQYAFDQFGDTIDANHDIVRRYTAALVDMKLAMQAVGDAAEVARIRAQIGEIGMQIGAVGGGGYASRLAQHQGSIATFQAERAGAAGGMAASAGGVAGSVASVSALLRGAFGGTITSTTGGKHVPNSYHYKGQAVDFVPRGGMRGTSKAQIRATLEAAGINILELLGPGDKDHADHFHVAFGGGRARSATGRAGGANMTGSVVGARNDLFSAQERLRSEQFLSASSLGATDNASRAAALRDGGPEALRLLELELKVQQAVNDNAPIYADQVEAAVRDADAAERRWQAEQAIFNLKFANDNQSRRNDALRTGNPAVLRQLELELRIEEIRRTQPADRQGQMIDAARTEDELRVAEQVARRTGEIRNQNKALHDQYELAQMIGDEQRIAAKLQEEKNYLYSIGSTMAGDELAAHLQLVEVLERQIIALEKQIERWQFIRDWSRELWTDVGNAGAKAFGELTRTGEVSWKGLMGSMEEAFYSALDRMVQQFIISPLITFATNMLTSGLSGLLGGGFGGGGGTPIFSPSNPGVPAATGMVVGNRGIIPFAGGDILNTPTGFFMPGGKRGLAGEGPGLYEAIMPLRRGPDGRLGVSGSGGGGGGGAQVNVYDMRAAGNSEAVEVEERQTGDGMRQINIMVRDAVKGHVRKGSFDADFRASFGSRRTVQRR
jgi:tape measure domain-containing protein